MTKEGYQPIKKETVKIIPPNTGSHVYMKKDGYTWEDMDRSFWEGFDTAKNKMEKRIVELEAQIEKMKRCEICAKSNDWKNRSLCIECEKSKSHINFELRR